VIDVFRGLLAVLAFGFAANAMAADVTVEVRDANGKTIADAVLYAEPVKGTPPAARPDAHAIIDQINKEFVPRVSIVQAGTSVNFPNSDNIRHSIYSFSPAKTFTTKLYAGREAAPVTFDKTGVVVLGCNIHDTMVAWVFIVDTPWFAKSGVDGTAVLTKLPAGEYHIIAAAAGGTVTTATIDVQVAEAPLRRTITLGAGL
jgi:plastocyanin